MWRPASKYHARPHRRRAEHRYHRARRPPVPPGCEPGRLAGWSPLRTRLPGPQHAELTAADGATSGFFGDSATISGSTAVVGTYLHNSASGAAYVFVNV